MAGASISKKVILSKNTLLSLLCSSSPQRYWKDIFQFYHHYIGSEQQTTRNEDKIKMLLDET